MQTFLTITRLSILLKVKDRSVFFISFVMPIIMMFILSTALGGFDETLLVDVIDSDNSEASAAFIERLRAEAEQTDTVVICVYGGQDNPDACDLNEEPDMEARLRDRVSSAGLEIRDGYADKLRDGERIVMVYRSDQNLNASTVTRSTVQNVIDRTSGSIAIADVGVETAEAIFGADPEQSTYNELFARAQAALETPPAIVSTATSAVVDELGANQSVPGTATMFVMINLLNTASVLIYERERGTLQRLFILPTNKVNIVGGKIFGEFFFGVIQFAIFVIVGVFMGVNWGNDPIAIAVIILLFCMASTALGFAMATFVNSSNQASGIALLMALTLAPLGGAWWPADIMPEFLQTVGQISPIAWAMSGIQELQFNNGSLLDIVPSLGVLAVMSALFFAVGVLNFEYE